MKSPLVVLLMFLNFIVSAQTPRQLWSKPVDPGLQWTFIATDGTLVTATTDEAPKDSTVIQFTTLRGIDPVTGNEKWKYTPPVTSLVPGVENVPNTLYFKLNTPPLIIVDPNEGRPVIDPDLYNEVYNAGYLSDPSRVWVEGLFGNTREFSMFDLASGKRLWSHSDYFEVPKQEEHKKYGIDKTVNKIIVKFTPPPDVKPSPPGLVSRPVVLGNDRMIIEIGDRVTYKKVFKISTIDGDIDLDTTSVTIPTVAEEQKWQLPAEIEVRQNEIVEIRNDGALLYSDQSARFINKDGTERYLNHYNKVSEFETQFFKSIVHDGLKFSGDNFLTLFTADGKMKTLEIIDKTSGATLSKIRVHPADLKPVFKIDEANKRLFYLYKENLMAFDFK